MNLRDYKEFGEGQVYHIYNRGNNKQDIFLDTNDFEFFLLRLKQNIFPSLAGNARITPLPEGSFSILSYCLMPNHFHLLVRQNTDIPTTKLLLKLCTSYSMYFNKKYDRVGQVFQDQYKQVSVDGDRYLKWLVAYINQNPTVAGLVKKPEQYKWSSYSGLLRDVSEICDIKVVAEFFESTPELKSFVDTGFDIMKDAPDVRYLLLD